VSPRPSHANVDSRGRLVVRVCREPLEAPLWARPRCGSCNFTEDAHPIRILEILFEVVDREQIENGTVRGPELWEVGARKDTVIAIGANSAGASAAKYALRRRAIPDAGGGPEWQLRWHF